MRVLMLSTDRKLLDPASSVSERVASYATLFETLTVVLAGRGVEDRITRHNLTIVYPGGRNRVTNFFNMLNATRALSADVITTQDPFYTGLIGVFSGKRPLQVQMHTDSFGAFGYLMALITLRFASCVRVVSGRIKEKLQPLTRAPITVLPIFVDAERFTTPTAPPPEYTGRPALLTAARLQPEKRLDRAIKALVDVKNAHLYIVGDGPLEAPLTALAAELQVSDRVHFLGWKQNLVAYYQHADCYVQSSAFEGYGMAVIEAALAGCPIVSTNVGVARDLPDALVTKVESGGYALAEAISQSLSQRSRASRREAYEAFLRTLPTRAEYLEQFKNSIATCGARS